MTANIRLKIIREDLRMTQKQMSEKLGMTQGGYSDVERGKDDIGVSREIKYRLENNLNVNTGWLETGEGDMFKPNHQHNKVQNKSGIVGSDMLNGGTEPPRHDERDDSDEGLPLIPFEIMAGFGEENDGVLILDCERYKIPEFKHIGAQFLVRVGGNSMYPKYSSGDILACKKIRDITFFQWGKIYVIDSPQGQIIKRICEHDDPDMIWLISDNKEKLSTDKEKYAPFAIRKDEIRSLSIVVGAVRME
jgi:phage repressor protein C with HTH and peptisase S24 domain